MKVNKIETLQRHRQRQAIAGRARRHKERAKSMPTKLEELATAVTSETEGSQAWKNAVNRLALRCEQMRNYVH